MTITRESDYAARIVLCLAQNGMRMDAKTIAESTGVTLRFSLKILNKLVSGGIVRSYKGSKGGYELARPASEISLGEVIEQVEGRYALSPCVGGEDFQCNRNTQSCAICRFHSIYAELSDLVRGRLEAVKFSDLLE